jgi:hypothetical protein
MPRQTIADVLCSARSLFGRIKTMGIGAALRQTPEACASYHAFCDAVVRLSTTGKPTLDQLTRIFRSNIPGDGSTTF